MLDLVDPWKWITIQFDRKYIISFLGFLAEHKTFSLGFVRVFMSAELKIFAEANSWQIFTIACKPDLLPEMRKMASAYPKQPRNKPLIWQPNPAFLRMTNNSSI